MKFVFLAGGIAGFLFAAASGLYAGRPADRVLFDAAVGCLVGAVLFRWFWNVLLHGFREAYLSRQRAATAAASTKTKT